MMIRTALTTLGMFALIPLLSLSAEPPFQPVPNDLKPLYRFDLNGNFYADDAAWQTDVDRARGMIEAMAAFRGKLADDPRDLLAYLDLKRDLTDLRYKLYAYGEFRCAVQTADRGPFEAYEELLAEERARTSFDRVELLKITPQTLDGWIADVPGLEPYRYIIEDVIRTAPHTLSEEEEALLALMGPYLTSWQPVLFQRAFDAADFPSIPSGGGNLDLRINFETLLRDPDRATRERAFREYYAKLRELSEPCGFALLRQIRAFNAQAELRGFDTHYDYSLFRRYLTRTQIDNLYAQVESRLPIFHDYQRFRLALAERDLALTKAEWWDLEAASGDTPSHRFDVSRATEMILNALEVLGPEYRGELGKLLDPNNGRMDIVGGPHRDQGAFCEAHYGYFMDNYQGFLSDVSTMAHEAGHAIHHQVELNHRKSLLFGEGPSYMTESFAMFNEWLIRDHLFKTEKDPDLLKSYRLDALNEMMYLWELSRRAKFEMAAYDAAAAGEATSAADLNDVCTRDGLKYDIFFERYGEMEVHWMRKHHYWSVPTYYVNYVVAHVLALTYYQRYLENPEDFARRYVAMQANGFDRPAAALLKDFLDIDLSDPRLLEGTFDLIRREFESVKKGMATRTG